MMGCVSISEYRLGVTQVSSLESLKTTKEHRDERRYAESLQWPRLNCAKVRSVLSAHLGHLGQLERM